MTTAVTLAALLITAAGFLTWETARRARAALRRVRRAAAAQDQIGDDTIRMLHPQWCNPCNDTPGRCTCAGLCGHPDCGGDHAVTWEMAAQLETMLKRRDTQ